MLAHYRMDSAIAEHTSMGIPEETTSARSLPDGLRDCGTYLKGYTRGDYKCSLLFRTGVCSRCAPSATNSSNTIPFLLLLIRFEFTTLTASMSTFLTIETCYCLFFGGGSCSRCGGSGIAWACRRTCVHHSFLNDEEEEM